MFSQQMEATAADSYSAIEINAVFFYIWNTEV